MYNRILVKVDGLIDIAGGSGGITWDKVEWIDYIPVTLPPRRRLVEYCSVYMTSFNVGVAK